MGPQTYNNLSRIRLKKMNAARFFSASLIRQKLALHTRPSNKPATLHNCSTIPNMPMCHMTPFKCPWWRCRCLKSELPSYKQSATDFHVWHSVTGIAEKRHHSEATRDVVGTHLRMSADIVVSHHCVTFTASNAWCSCARNVHLLCWLIARVCLTFSGLVVHDLYTTLGEHVYMSPCCLMWLINCIDCSSSPHMNCL